MKEENELERAYHSDHLWRLEVWNFPGLDPRHYDPQKVDTDEETGVPIKLNPLIEDMGFDPEAIFWVNGAILELYDLRFKIPEGQTEKEFIEEKMDLITDHYGPTVEMRFKKEEVHCYEQGDSHLMINKGSSTRGYKVATRFSSFYRY